MELSQQAATWQTKSLMGSGMELQRKSENAQSVRESMPRLGPLSERKKKMVLKKFIKNLIYYTRLFCMALG